MKKFRKILTVFLSICMLSSSLLAPMTAHAANPKAPTPIASPGSGTQADNTAITLSSDGTDIYYTLDGSMPNTSSTLYDDAHKPTVQGPTIIKAVAVGTDMDDSDVATFYYNVAIYGNVTDSAGLPVSDGGVVDISSVDNNAQENHIGNAQITADGKFYFPTLGNGTYRITAHPSNSSPDFRSEFMEFNVSNNHSDIQNPTLQFRQTQVKGSVLYPNNDPVNGSNFFISVKSTDPAVNNTNFEWDGQSGVYKVCGLANGTYKIKAVAQNETTATSSFESTITITDGMTNPLDIPLKLTTPQVSGSVTDPLTNSVNGGSIDVYDSLQEYKNLGNTQIKSDGTYLLGGLEDGTYYIKATPSQGSIYDSSNKTQIVIAHGSCTPNTLDLQLTNKVPKIKSIDSAAKGDNRVTMRIRNANLISDISKITGAITGGPALTNPQLNQPDNNGEAMLSFDVQGGIQLNYGQYPIVITYNGNQLPSELGSEINIIQRVIVNPSIILPANYPGSTINIDVEGTNKEYQWTQGDSLSIKVNSNQNGSIEYTVIPTINNDNTLTFTVPAQVVTIPGGQSIEIRKNGVLLARGNLQVGSPQIDQVAPLDQGDNFVRINGSFLSFFKGPNPIAEIYNSNNDKLATTSNINFNDNEIQMFFNTSISTLGTYSIKLYVNSLTIPLPGNGSFNVVPKLSATHAITGQDPKETITIYNPNNLWSNSDPLSVRINGPSGGFDVANSDITFDSNSNLVAKMTAGQGHMTQGSYYVELRRSNNKIGFCRFIVGSDVIEGTVKNPDESLVSGGKIDIINKDNNNRRTVDIESDGKYYISKDEMPGNGNDINGNYVLNVIPQDNSIYSGSETNVTINNNSIQGLILHLLVPQISGTVVDPTINHNPVGNTNVNIDILDNNGNSNYLTSVAVNSNGTFNIGGLDAGQYRLSANAPGGSNFISSQGLKVTVGQTAVTGVVLTLGNVQLSGIVKDSSGNNANGGCVDIYEGSLQSLNFIGNVPVNNDGTFRIGGLPNGKYYLKARPQNEQSSESSSIITEVNLSDTPVNNFVLSLRVKALRIAWVNNANSGDDRIRTRIINFRSLNSDPAKLTAVVYQGSSPVLTINNPNNFKMSWNDNNDADIEIIVDGGVNLPINKYTLKLRYDNGSELPSEINSDFNVLYRMNVTPNTLKPGEAPGKTIKLTANKDNNGNVVYPWKTGDNLVVHLTPQNAQQSFYTLPYSINASDNSLLVTLPSANQFTDGQLPQSKYTIDVTKGQILLASCNFDVGVPEIKDLPVVREGDDQVYISGDYLSAFTNENTKVEVWNSDGTTLIQKNSDVRDMGNWRGFYFNGKVLPAGNYKLKMFYNGNAVNLPNNGAFSVIPYLDCTPHAISGQTNGGEKITISKSKYTAFAWTTAAGLEVRTWGQGNDSGMYFSSGNGLTVNNSGDIEIITNKTLQLGNAGLDVYLNGVYIGFSNFTVGQDIIAGKIVNPDVNQTTAIGGKVNINNLDKHWGRDIFVNSKGQFYINASDLMFNNQLNNGQYQITAYPPDGSNYAAAKLVVDIENGQLVGTTNQVKLVLAVPQVTGRVVTPDGLSGIGGCNVDVFQVSNYQWNYVTNIQADSNGNFKLAGLEPGNYVVRAWPDTNTTGYVSSPEIKITVGDNKVASPNSVQLKVSKPQIKGTISGPNGNVTKYHLSVEPVNYIPDLNWNWSGWDSSYLLWGLKDGVYRLRAVPDTSAYAPSDAVTIEVKDGKLYKVNNSSPINDTIDMTVTLPQIAGKLTDPVSHNAITGGGWIDVRTDNQYIMNINVDPNTGEFAIGGLEKGTSYILKAYPPNNSEYTESKELKLIINNDGTYKINGGSDRNDALSIELSNAVLKGYVVDPNNKPISYGNVDIRDLNGMGYPGFNVDEAGTFKLYELNDGTYKLTASQWNSKYTPSKEMVIKVVTENGKKVIYDADNNKFGEGYNLVLQLTNPIISGTVIDSNNNFIPNAWVDIRKKIENSNGKDEWIPGVCTDATGIFSLGGLADGTYIVRANPPGNSDLTQSDERIIVVSSDSNGNKIVKGEDNVPFGDNNLFVITLNSPQVIGSLVRPDGSTPENNGWIEIYKKVENSDNSKEWIPGVGIQNGKFSIGGLKEGTYVLVAHPDGASNYTPSDEITIKIVNVSGNLVAMDINNVPFGQGHPLKAKLNTVQFVVNLREPNGTDAAKYCYVEVRTEDGQWLLGTSANENGIANLGGLKDGVYILRAYPNWGTTFTPSNEVKISISGSVKTIDTGSGPVTYNGNNLVLTLKEAQVLGNVITPNGDPHAYGWVEINSKAGNWNSGIGIDGDGNFVIGGLEPGVYTIKAHPDGDAGYSSSAETVITIKNDGSCSDSNVSLMLNTPQLTGEVFAPDGQTRVNYGWIDIRTEEGNWLPGVSVNQGVFSIGSLADGTYIMKAYPDGQSEYTESAEQRVTVKNGTSTPATLSFTLSSPTGKGVVKLPGQTGNARYGWVDVRKQVGDHYEGINGFGVDYNGNFKLGALADGTYLLRANADGNSDYAASADLAIIIETVNANKVVKNAATGAQYTDNNPIILQLTNPKLRGILKNPSGTSVISYGWVEISKDLGNGQREWIDGTGVDQQGRFKIGSLAQGSYFIKVHPDWQSTYADSAEVKISVNANGDATIVSGATLSNGQMIVKLTNIQLSGVVLKPISGAKEQNGWIQIQKQNGGNWDEVNGVGVQWDGTFKISGLSDGTYRVRAFPNGSDSDYSASVFTTVNIANGILTNTNILTGGSLNLTLVQPQITGTIQGPNSENIAFGWVEIRDSNNAFVTGIGANQEGKFSISGLADGTYTIKAFSSAGLDFAPSTAATFTVSGQTITGDIGNTPVLQLNSAQVSGIIRGPNGETITKGWVETYKDDGSGNYVKVASAPIDKEGKFKFVGLVDGSYQTRAIAEPGSGYTNSNASTFVIQGSTAKNAPNGTPIGAIKLILNTPDILGKVIDSGSHPVKDGWVELGDSNSNWIASIPLDANGNFSLGKLTPGTDYKIQAFRGADSNKTSSSAVSFTTTGDGSYNVQIVLQINP